MVTPFNRIAPVETMAGPVGQGRVGPLSVTTTVPRTGVAVLTVVGELDMQTVPVLDAALAEVRDDARVVLDLSRVSFLGSAGLHVLLTEQERTLDTGRSLALVVSSQLVRRPLEITGMVPLFEVHAELTAAVGG